MRTPQSSLLRDEQVQLLKSFFAGEVLQPPDHLCSPQLDSPQHLQVLVLGASDLDLVFRVGE